MRLIIGQVVTVLMILSFWVLPGLAKSEAKSEAKPQTKQTAKWLPGSRMFEQQGYRLELFAQKKEGSKAFMIGRGMSTKNATFYSQKACSFGSAQGNVMARRTDPSIEIDLTKWRAVPTGKEGTPPPAPVKLLLREDWEKEWKKRGVSEDVQAAFYWSLFPTKQQYAPTDYNWGGVTVPLPAGTVFDLHVRWKRGQSEQSAIIKGLKCRP